MIKLSQNSMPLDSNNRGIVLAEANFDQPSKEEKMARRRYQDPKPKREGRWWYLIYWEDVSEDGEIIRKRIRENLAPATMPERASTVKSPSSATTM